MVQKAEGKDQDEQVTLHVLTAFTDGHVAVWAATAAPSPVATQHGEQNRLQPQQRELQLAVVVKLHQSSIKSLDMAESPVEEGRGRWRVVTGGDDNALIFCDLALTPQGRYTVLSRHRIASAHAAGITGVCITSFSQSNDTEALEVVTVSNDQRIKLWRAESLPQEEGQELRLKVQLLENKYSGIADAGAVEVVDKGRVMVAGVGVEVWDLVKD